MPMTTATNGVFGNNAVFGYQDPPFDEDDEHGQESTFPVTSAYSNEYFGKCNPNLNTIAVQSSSHLLIIELRRQEREPIQTGCCPERNQ